MKRQQHIAPWLLAIVFVNFMGAPRIIPVAHQPDNLEAVRQGIIAAIWSGQGLPVEGATVAYDLPDPLGGIPNLARVDRLTINMGNGFVARPWVFRPADSNRRLVLVHHGHGTADLVTHGISETVGALVAYGFTVVGLVMPGNTRHLHAYPQPTPELNYLRYFIEPVVRAINHLEPEVWELIGMTGISGGGWTTTLAAAVDTRIRVSVPVAGSLPFYLRTHAYDWEQGLPGLDLAHDYLDLYALAAGDGRRQVQLLNVHDPCCFASKEYNSSSPYHHQTAAAAAALGGSWQIIWDDSHRDHIISTFARQLLLEEFSQQD